MSDKFNNRYRISSCRLQNRDYSQNGNYFLTICTKNRKNYFGEIENKIMKMSVIGKIAKYLWQTISTNFSFIVIDNFVIMPNHIHGILFVNHIRRDAIAVDRRDAINRVSTGGITGKYNPILNQSISTIIRWFKGRCSFEINKGNNKKIILWQTRFYDHIIRDEKSLQNIRMYIDNNPARWKDDRNNQINL